MSVQALSPAYANNRAADNTSPGGFDYNRIQGVQGNPNVGPAFIAKVEAMAERLGTQPEYLIAVMSFESGGTFGAGTANAAGSGATGLIQFMPDTARGLGTSTEALARMSSVDQLDYVERYFAGASQPGDLNTLEGVYTTVLAGSPHSDPDSTLFQQGTAAYQMNSPLDTNSDGRITSGEATSFVRARIDGDLPAGNAAPTAQVTPAGPAIPTTTPADVPAGNDGQYTVQSGNTLSGIASQFNADWHALARDNGIADPNLILAGQNLRVASGSTSTQADPALNPQAVTTGAGAADPITGAGRANGGASVDRNDFYLQQPGSWQCGPTSLTMALAAWGLRPADAGTLNEMVGLTGANSSDGVPGDASLVAEAAKQAGAQASFNPDGSAAAVRAALEAGHTVVLNGSLSSGGHFIYVAGIDDNGNFIVGDPARPEITTMTAGELEAFSYANPGQHPNGFAEIWR